MSAQQNNQDLIFTNNIPAGLGKPIHMPELEYHPDFNPDNFFSYKQKVRVFIITSDSVYHNLFA